MRAFAGAVAAVPAQPGPDPPRPPAVPTDLKTAIPDSVLARVYANQVMVNHSGEEVLIHFVSLFPPQGVVTARVFVSPGHLRRMMAALQENFRRYESVHGKVTPANMPPPDSTYVS